jgi:hypothetical protein
LRRQDLQQPSTYVFDTMRRVLMVCFYRTTVYILLLCIAGLLLGIGLFSKPFQNPVADQSSSWEHVVQRKRCNACGVGHHLMFSFLVRVDRIVSSGRDDGCWVGATSEIPNDLSVGLGPGQYGTLSILPLPTKAYSFGTSQQRRCQ